MKTKIILATLLSAVMVGSAFAQDIEQDDMYFNKKDRAKLREAEKSNVAYASNRKSKDDSNPTDSYSARNVNPEYTSRSQSETTQADESDYYVSNYRYANQGYYNDFSNRYNNWYNDPWYRSNYYSSSIHGWNSPYYGSQFDMWGNPWANPYYRSGWSSGFSFYYGRSWNYGWNNCVSCSPFGYYNDPFYNPYYGYNPYNGFAYSPFGYGAGFGPSYFGGWNRPYRVVYIDNDDYRANYGKRNSRSSQFNRDNYGSVRSNGRVAEGRDGRTNSGGRVNTNRQQEYYNNSWRNTERTNTYSTPSRSASPTWDNTNNNSNSGGRSSWESQQRSNPSNSTPSRSGGFDAGRSSTPSSGGNSSGSGSRSSRGN